MGCGSSEWVGGHRIGCADARRGPSVEVQQSNFVHELCSFLEVEYIVAGAPDIFLEDSAAGRSPREIGCARLSGNLSGRLFRLLRREAGRRLRVFVEFEDVDFEIRGCDLWQAWRKPVFVENGSGTNGRFG